MKPFRAIEAKDATANTMCSAIEEDGYLLIRGVVPREALEQLLDEITQVIAASGWLLPGHDPMERMADIGSACGDPDPGFKRTYQEVFNLAAFHALPHHPELKRVMKMLVGDRVLVHPKPIGRLIFPQCDRLTVHAHQDYRFMGGDPECFTVWIPLHDCPVEVGPLRILEGSHRFGIIKHEDENLHVPEISTDKAMAGEWVEDRSTRVMCSSFTASRFTRLLPTFQDNCVFRSIADFRTTGGCSIRRTWRLPATPANRGRKSIQAGHRTA